MLQIQYSRSPSTALYLHGFAHIGDQLPKAFLIVGDLIAQITWWVDLLIDYRHLDLAHCIGAFTPAMPLPHKHANVGPTMGQCWANHLPTIGAMLGQRTNVHLPQHRANVGDIMPT